jgi:hypothetical protein
LSDGTLTHDAAFQAVDEKKSSAQLAGGRTEINFVDSWRYNVAAYGLAVALGLGDMMPVTVERTWNGKTGALAWWLDTRMDEQERLKTKTNAPDPTAWNNEMHRLRLFTELVADTDRNLGNVLVSPDWHVLMIDFTRAFRIWDNIRPKELVRCDRALLARVEALTLDSVAEATGEYLTRYEREAVLKRRDKIVAHFKQLVAQMGEQRVLY